MPLFIHTIVKADFRAITLSREIVTAGLPRPIGIRDAGASIDIGFQLGADLSAPQVVTLNSVVTAHDNLIRDDSILLKRARLEGARRLELATFVVLTKEICADDRDRIHRLKTASAILTYPVTIRTADGREELSIANAGQVDTLFAALIVATEAVDAAMQAAMQNIIDAIDDAAAIAALKAYRNS